MPYTYDYPHPAVTTDIVLFTIKDEALNVLLIERGHEPFKGSWALPGGFVEIDEDLREGAKRELAEETGLSGIFLEQLYTFGAPNRDPRERVISVAYYALVPSPDLPLKAGSDARAVAWHSYDELPDLAFDHRQILNTAHERLLAKLDYSTIAFMFLPETFTLTALQSVYEIISKQPRDKRNFRKWVLSLDVLEDTGTMSTGGAHRPAKLYRAKNRSDLTIVK